MELTKPNSKKLYEVVLSINSGEREKEQAIISILKLAVIDQSCFTFLINQIDWFCDSNKHLIPLLSKVMRLYRGTSRSAAKVIYNLMTEGFSVPVVNLSIVEVAVQLLSNPQDFAPFLAEIRRNYPHKVCPLTNHLTYQKSLFALANRLPKHRIDFLEIVIENLTYFDTQMVLGEEFINDFQPQDAKIINLSSESGQLQQKYDCLLASLLDYLSRIIQMPQHAQQLLKELFIIFDKAIILIDNTKTIQLTMFFVAEFSPKTSAFFVSLLLATIMENYNCSSQNPGNYRDRRYLSALHYLTSYIYRSLQLGTKRTKKIMTVLMSKVRQNISEKEVVDFNAINIRQHRQQNIQNLYMLQSILYVLIEYPQVKKELADQLGQLLQICQNTLCFSAFLNRELLSSLSYTPAKNCHKESVIEINNKFMPVFLKKSGQFIKMRIKVSGKRIRRLDHESGMPSKRNCQSMTSAQTPITTGEAQI